MVCGVPSCDGSVHVKDLTYLANVSMTELRSIVVDVVLKAVNIVAIGVLSRGTCGLTNCTTRYLMAMAMADLLVIITDVILYRISYFVFPASFLNITPVCSVLFVLARTTTDYSVWFTVTFTFDRFIAICCQKLKTKYCTAKAAVAILVTTSILLFLKNIPNYFVLEAGDIVDNISWGCYFNPNCYTDPGWIVFDWFDAVLNPLLPIVLMMLLNTLTVRHILMTSRIRKGLIGRKAGDIYSDSEMESRRKSVILLFAISASFILLWLVSVIHFFYDKLTRISTDTYKNLEYIIQRIGFMLQNLSCCTNTFIYGVTQSKFREQVKRVVKYPFISMFRSLHNKIN
ncbi:probable G-protein coupled receptor 139 [Rhincodon typus]|uniref:probable G-protein coupled receptor 139 n=1 Tax=Rhincodon typus TaxID=259920 RepID=UPI00202F2A4F|nr:probable G-protein coupled receptor 139 [Rhincodon typus]